MPTLRDLISDARVHVLDGAMGTMLYGKGIFLNVCYDELALKQPDLVAEVHDAYVRAGAEAIETNTFGANPVKLAGHGLAEQTEELNRAAAALARRVAGDRVAVLGAVGPLGVRLEPFGPTSRAEARDAFRRQIAGLVAGGVDGLLVADSFTTLASIIDTRGTIRSVRFYIRNIHEDFTVFDGVCSQLLVETI